MNIVSVLIPANKTYSHRVVTMIRVDFKMSMHQFITGILEIREARTEKSTPKINRYAFKEFPDQNGDRTFRVVKPGGDTYYNVCISGESTIWDICDCKGWEKTGWCRHCAALRELIDRGHLNPESKGEPASS